MSADGSMEPVKLFSLEAEESVLSGLMAAPQKFYAVSALITSADFWNAENAVTYRHIERLAKAGHAFDWVNLIEAMRDAGELEAGGGQVRLSDLTISYATTQPEGYAQRVRELAQRRRVVKFCEETIAAARSESAEELAMRMSHSVDSLLRSGTAESLKFQELASRACDQFRANRNRRAKGELIGAPTGLPLLDEIVGGFHGPRLIILAARPKCGKTAFLNQFAVHAAMRGKPGLVCSLEMGSVEIAGRALATHSGANLTRLLKGEADDLSKAETAIGNLGDLPLYFDFETTEVDRICAQIALHKQRYGIQWAAVDHIGLVKAAGKFQSTNDRIGHISWTLKQLAKRLEIPVIALSQLSRTCDKEQRKPRADDLRDSGNLEQDADMVLMIHVPVKTRNSPERDAQVGITANRAGPSLWLPATYRFVGATQRFHETEDAPIPDQDPTYGNFDSGVPPSHWSDN